MDYVAIFSSVVVIGSDIGASCAPRYSHANFIPLSTGEVGKLLGEKWKELSAKEKEPYEKKAKDDKERYEREKAAYAEVR